MSAQDAELAEVGVAASKPKTESQLKSLISGGIGGVCIVLVGHPFDLVKVRIQTASASAVSPSTFGMLRSTFVREGVGGLYRGVGPPLLALSPMFAVTFWGYDMGKRLVRHCRDGGDGPLSIGEIGVAGALSAIPATALAAPTERVKCLLQVQANEMEKQGGGRPKYRGMADCAWQVFREGGISSLFKGTLVTLLREVPANIAWFGTYECIKRSMSGGQDNPDHLSPFTVMLAGGLAGMAGWVVSIPPDVIKSRWQTAAPGEYRGLWHIYTSLVQTEGYGALFKGLRPALIRAFPADAACFLGMEVSRKLLSFMD